VRVAVVAETFHPTVNGVSGSVGRVLEYLGRTGHQALVVAPAPGPDRHGSFPVLRVPSAAGRRVLDELGLPAAGFNPPGWLHSPGTMRALLRSGLHYTTSHRAVVDLRSGQSVRSRALSHRHGGAGERVAAALLRRSAAATAGRGGTVRIALHPADLSRPDLAASSLRAVDAALAPQGGTA
jgi:hypothetical protein